jgi:TolB-like protein/Tfp pilus assembly protein PilF
MTDTAHSDTGGRSSESDETSVRAQLDRIIKSGPFRTSKRRQRFLKYLVNETLAGRGEQLKAYTIALEVFERPASFDPLVDPLVRIEAGRLRDKLREYYDVEGQDDPVRIELPKGSYAPKIEFRQAARSPPKSEPADRTTPDRPTVSLQTPIMPADEQQARDISNSACGTCTEDEVGSNSYRSTLSKIGWTLPRMSAVAVLLIVAASLLWMKGPYFAPALPDKPSIAVIPFDSIGDDPKWKRFADGVTEDIITDLSRSKNLVVIARNSTETYRNKLIDIRKMGQDLGVKYVLEGSIQWMGERIRVTAQLIEAASATHIWSERYDRPADDLFAVQNDVTQRIAATLAGYEGAVAEAERSLLRRRPPANLTAFDTYLLAMEAKHKVTKEGLVEAEGLFHKALELDSQLARAYVGLATVQFYLIDLGLAPSVEKAVSKMRDAAERAVKLDPHDGLTHQVLGMAYGYEGKPEQSLAELNRAEILAPSDADLLLSIAWSLPAFGESARAVSLAERALRLNPNYPDWYNQGLSLVYFFGGQYDRSVTYRLLVKEPLALDYAFLAIAYAHMDRAVEAKKAAANVERLDRAWIAERYLSEAGGFAEQEADAFISGARRAGLPDCVPSDKLKDSPNLIRVKSCDQKRARMAG